MYLNDIKGCEVAAVNECGDNIEIVYIKEGVQKSLTIEHYEYSNNMGHGYLFRISSVELPMILVHKERLWDKCPFEQFQDIRSIVQINSYMKQSNGYEEAQQIEIIYKNDNDEIHTYLMNSDLLIDDDCEKWMVDIIKKDFLPSSSYEMQKCHDERLPSELFSVDIYKTSLAFALKAHGEQKTPDGLPYSFHITSVALEVINSLSMHRISHDEANVAIACALLHDVQEDTDTRIGTNSLDIPDIQIVLQGIWALTKDKTLPTKEEQMHESLNRLRTQPRCVQMVKLADRITNLAPAPDYWNEEKRKSYAQEAQKILDALRGCNPYLEERLQYRIDNWERVYCLKS